MLKSHTLLSVIAKITIYYQLLEKSATVTVTIAIIKNGLTVIPGGIQKHSQHSHADFQSGSIQKYEVHFRAQQYIFWGLRSTYVMSQCKLSL